MPSEEKVSWFEVSGSSMVRRFSTSKMLNAFAR
jgi:hypothetical protein